MEKSDHWQVYQHINQINGKRYIGITGTSAAHRWGQGYKGCRRFYNAINKYGWNAFSHEVIKEGLTKEEAEALEIKLIAEYQTQDPKYGYNIMEGGHAPSLAEETKQKISNANKGHGDRGGGVPKRKVICVETQEVFPSCSAAARWCNSNSSHICYCCKGKHKTAKGYHWEYVD